MSKRGLSMYNKRGQELTIGTLILILLGITVLILLVLGFSIGWQNLFSKIGIISGSDLSTMVATCKVAAVSDSLASYCEFKKVKIGDKTLDINCEYSDVKAGLDVGLDGCPESVTRLYRVDAGGEKVPVCKSTDGNTATDAKCLCGTTVCDTGKKCKTDGNICN